MIVRAPKKSPAPPRRPSRSFTLTELLVVIALIALLIGLLLAALGQVLEKKKESQTLATMQSFANACDTFYQENGYLPGIVPENILAMNPNVMSSTENILFHLTGGYVREADFGDPSDFATLYPVGAGAADWHQIDFNTSGGGTYSIKVNLSKIGEGPIVDGKVRAPYFTPGEHELTTITGQVQDGLPSDLIDPFGGLPDLVDAWGQPIICLRQARPSGPISDSSSPSQFEIDTMAPYLLSSALGELGADQGNSILTAGPPEANFTKIVEHAGLRGQAKGKVVLLSAGEDGVFFSQFDGPGSPGNPEPDISGFSHSVINEYDDVVLFTGG